MARTNQPHAWLVCLSLTLLLTVPVSRASVADKGAAAAATSTCDVTHYGAKGDNATKDTAAILQAVKACSAGGVVLLPRPGRYLTAPFNLTSNQILRVEDGAMLMASYDLGDYPQVPVFPSYGSSRDIANSSCRYAPVVGAFNATNVSISGGGILDGQGWTFWGLKDANKLNCSRPHLVEFENVQGAVLDQITMINSPFWTSHFIYSDSITVTNCTVLAPATRGNTDGFNPDSSTNVHIEDCFVSNGDDGIAIKSGLNYAGYTYNKSCENITIKNVTTHGRGGIAIGSEMSGGVRNVHIENVRLLGQRGVHMKTTKGRGGYFENITYINVTAPTGIELWTDYKGGNKSGPWPALKYLHFINISSKTRCSVGCGSIPEPTLCDPSTFTYKNACGKL